MYMDDANWEFWDKNDLYMVILGLGAIINFNIMKEKITKGVIDRLAKMYDKHSTLRKVSLIKRLFNLIFK